MAAARASAVAEREAGEDGEDDAARHVDHAVDEVGDVLGVVAEVGDRRTRPSEIGRPASGPPLAICAASMLARNSVCMWIQADVQISAP